MAVSVGLCVHLYVGYRILRILPASIVYQYVIALIVVLRYLLFVLVQFLRLYNVLERLVRIGSLFVIESLYHHVRVVLYK